MTHDLAALSLPDLDSMDPLDALQLVGQLRAWTLEAATTQTARARFAGVSWLKISNATGMTRETLLRWTKRGAPPRFPRLREELS